jgi:phage terminase small subunit
MSVPKEDLRLTRKQEDFVSAYLDDDECRFDAVKSARKAGYTENSIRTIAFTLIKDPRIVERINSRIAKVEAKNIATYSEKIRMTWELLMKAYHEADIPNFVKLLQELNKMQGHYSPDKIAVTNLNVDTDIQTLKKTMEELRLVYNKDY